MKHCYQLICGMIIFLLLCGPAAAAPWESAEALGQWLETELPVILQKHHVPGSVLAVVHEGQMAAIAGYGFADRETRLPVDPELAVFPGGYVSVVFTHAALLHLMEQGRLERGRPVTDYVAGLPWDYTYETPLTIHHLLTHTHGLESRDIARFALEATALSDTAAILDRELKAPVLRPGSFVTFGAYGAALSTRLIQLVSGMNFASYVQQAVFDPLQMEKASFAPVLPGELDERLVKTYYWDNGQISRAPRFFSQVPAHDGVTLTAVDAAAFLAALTQPPDGEESSPAPDVPDAEATDDTEIVFSWQTAGQWLAGLQPIQEQAADHVSGISYGFFETSRQGQTVLMIGGSALGVFTQMVLLPESNIGLFYAQNIPGDGAFEELFATLLEMWFPGESSRLPTYTGKMNLDAYGGHYRAAQTSQHTLAKLHAIAAGDLKVESSGGMLEILSLGAGDHLGGFGVEPSRWRPVAPLTFQRIDGEDMIVFTEDSSGDIVGLYSLQSQHGSYYPVASWQSGSVQLTIAGAALFVLALNIVIMPIKLLLRRGWRPLQPVPFSVRVVPWWSLVVSILFIGGAAAIIYELVWQQTAGMPAYAGGISQWARSGLASMVTGVGALGILVLLLLAVWRSPVLHSFSRFWQSFVVLAGTAISLWLWHWNLLGYWF